MNILHIIHNLRREGAQIVLRNLVTHKMATHQQYVFAWKLGGPLVDELRNEGITVLVPDSHRSIATPRLILNDLGSAIRQHNIDVLHAHLPDSALWGALASRQFDRPLIVTYHSNQLVPPASRISQLLHYFALLAASRGTKRHVAVSESVRDQVIRKLKVDPNIVTVIPNGIAIPTETSPNTPANSSLHIVAVGRLVDIKAHEQLLEALPAVIKRVPQTHCTLVGDGPRRAILEELVQDLAIAQHVTFAGATSDVTTYLRQADLYVSTSQFEGIPMATLEAMAWNIPVIVSNVPGNRDVVSDGVSGLHYSWGDTAQLSDAILRMFENPQLADAMCRVARAKTIETYSLDAMSARYAQLYQQVAITKSSI